MFLDEQITWAEDLRTKNDKNNPTTQQTAVSKGHTLQRPRPTSILRRGFNLSYALATSCKRSLQLLTADKHVRFHAQNQLRSFDPNDDMPMATYDSGADGNYISEDDRIHAQLPILRRSKKRVCVANDGTSEATFVTEVPIPQLSPRAKQADSFRDFPHSLISVGTVADDNTVSIFTKDGVTVHRENNVLITCQGEPIFIGVHDNNGRYRVPLIQSKGQWQPRQPTKRARIALEQANSVYDLPSTEQAIRWMHAVCGYPVKSTWLKAVKAGNFVGWPLLTEQNINKYYPDATETHKGHMNQSRKMYGQQNKKLLHSKFSLPHK
jgi:hypothetical protein